MTLRKQEGLLMVYESTHFTYNDLFYFIVPCGTGDVDRRRSQGVSHIDPYFMLVQCLCCQMYRVGFLLCYRFSATCG